jgi:hypothetical protein
MSPLHSYRAIISHDSDRISVLSKNATSISSPQLIEKDALFFLIAS